MGTSDRERILIIADAFTCRSKGDSVDHISTSDLEAARDFVESMITFFSVTGNTIVLSPLINFYDNMNVTIKARKNK